MATCSNRPCREPAIGLEPARRIFADASTIDLRTLSRLCRGCADFERVLQHDGLSVGSTWARVTDGAQDREEAVCPPTTNEEEAVCPPTTNEAINLQRLAHLADLDERLRDTRHRVLLNVVDRKIVNAALARGDLNRAAIGQALKLSRSQVSRRIGKLIRDYEYLRRYLETGLGEEERQSWQEQKAFLSTYVSWWSPGSFLMNPEPEPSQILNLEKYELLRRKSQGSFDARLNLGMVRQIRKPTKKCASCGRFIPRRAKSCSARCRQRLRRRR